MAIATHLTLNSGYQIPTIALGVYQTPPEETEKIVLAALEAGYRHIDSAQYYHNEEDVARAIAKWIAKNPAHNKRKNIFYTTKIYDQHVYEKTKKAVEVSLERAKDIDYIDLLLLHSPQSDYERRHGSWLAFQEFVESGKVRSIGVSNYGVKHIKELLEYPDLKIKPAVNQVELHPWLTREDIVDYAAKHGIIIEAYSPLVRGQKMDDPTLVKIAEKYNKTPAQILINWSLSKGYIPLPNTSQISRLASNHDAAQFELSKEDIGTLSSLNERLHTCWDPTLYPLGDEK